jgi:hypothetical protein
MSDLVIVTLIVSITVIVIFMLHKNMNRQAAFITITTMLLAIAIYTGDLGVLVIIILGAIFLLTL